MHNNEISRFFWRFLGFSSSFLSVLFWVLLIFGFDEPRYAAITVIAAVIHEAGHVFYHIYMGGGARTLRGRLGGLLLGKGVCRSYGEELTLYLCGPLANFIAALLAFLFLRDDIGTLFSAVNIATGVSNLLPVQNYDGYGIIKSAMNLLGMEEEAIKILPTISLFFVCVISLLSLYLMDRFDGGYWIYAVFFTSLVVQTGKSGLLR